MACADSFEESLDTDKQSKFHFFLFDSPKVVYGGKQNYYHQLKLHNFCFLISARLVN